MDTQTKPDLPVHPGARLTAACLEQGLALLRELNDEHFAATLPPVFNSGVGAHIRHILDHFDCLLSGLDKGRVDYDCRERSTLIEENRYEAITATQKTINRLFEIHEQPDEVFISVKLDSNGMNGEWSASSLSRELQFLSSHTIHHYALIRAILGNMGIETSSGFGVSPSTLRHQQK